MRHAPGDAVSKGHADSSEDRRILTFEDGVRPDRSIVAKAGLLGVIAVGVGIVRRTEDRVDDELGKIGGIEL